MFTYNDLYRFTAFFKNIIEEHSDSIKWPIAFLSESSDMLIFAIAACWKLGVPFIPLNPKLSKQELEAQITALSPSIIFCDSKNRGKINSKDIIHMDENFFLNAFTFDIKKVKIPDESKIEESSVFGYFFTSGTSAKAKIVPLKRKQLIAAAKASAQNFKPDPNHYWLLCMPLNHVGGITIILRSLIYGSAIYRMEVFHEEMVKEFLGENSRFQAASFVPTMLQRLLNDPLFKTHRGLKAILLGGGPVTESLLKKAVERGLPIVSTYGMTETCAQIAANPTLAPSGTYIPLKSVGKPFPPNELQIRDDNCKILGPNQSGTIWLKGPQVFDGYFDKENNGKLFDEDGWFNTGDYGHKNGFDQVFIESRRTDLIITGGENVNPLEVEEAIQKLSGIKEVVVIGLPNEEWGQIVTAFVTLSNGNTPDLQEIREELKSKLIDFKLPKQLRIVKEFPKTATGKIKRAELAKFIQ